MFDARRLVIDAICVAVLALLMVWGAKAIASVPETLPMAAADCDKPTGPPKQTTVAGGLPGLNLADCGDKEKAGEPAGQPATSGK
jgi:hypothetical protein